MPWELITKGLQDEPGQDPPAQPSLIERLWRIMGRAQGQPRHNTVAFTIALVSLSAKLAKADGVASRVEAEVFEKLHHVATTERANVRQMFDLAAKDTAGFDDYAAKIADLLGRDPILMSNVLEGLFQIAVADGILHPEEERYLKSAATVFGFSADGFRAMRALFVYDPDDPYTVLSLAPDVDTATLKARFRQLVREHHPDQLIARGLPATQIALATDRLAVINVAYDRIAQERGL